MQEVQSRSGGGFKKQGSLGFVEFRVLRLRVCRLRAWGKWEV